MIEHHPVCTILGGPNGSGKSSIYDALKPVGPFVNADKAARLINPRGPEAASFAAGRRVLEELASLLRARKNFVYETTLSSHQPIELMRRARHAGYEIGLVFVVLANIDLNVERVAQRVARGGHDIPEPIIRRRHGRAISQLGRAVLIADETVVLDNTGYRPQVILRIGRRTVAENRLDLNEPVHARIWQIVKAALRSDDPCG